MITLLTVYADECNNSEEDNVQLDSKVSNIKTEPPFFTGKELITLQSPNINQTGLNLTNGWTFSFNAAGVEHGMLLILSSGGGKPSTSDVKNNLTGLCIAGAASFAGHSWDGQRISAGSNQSSSGLYACTSNAEKPLSTTQKKAATELAPTTEYYWLVLGYDKNFLLTHSSPLRKFTTN